MTPDEFIVAARFLIGSRTDVAFRARPGPRALRRREQVTVVCVDLEAEDPEQDMKEGLNRV